MRRVGQLALYALLLLVGLGSTFRPTLGSGFALVQTDAGDTLLNHYVLEHSWLWLTGAANHRDLWSPPFFAPAQGVLAYSENLLGSAPLYWAWRAFLPPVPAFGCWMLAAAALDFAACLVALRRFRVDFRLAALGAYVFAFGMAHTVQLGHQQLLARWMTPLALVAWWRFTRRPQPGRLAVALAWTAWQMLACVYMGWFLCLSLALFVPALGLARTARRRLGAFVRRSWWSALLLGATWAGVLLPVLGPYIAVNRGHHRPWSECAGYLPEPADWMRGAPGGVWDGVGLTGVPASVLSGEFWLFCGFTPLFLCVVGVCAGLRGRWSNPTAKRPTHDTRVAVAAAFAAIVLFLAVSDWGVRPWRVVFEILPGAKAIRAPGRIFVVVYLLGTLAGGLALTRRARFWTPRVRSVVFGALLCGGVLEQWRGELPSFPADSAYGVADELAAQLAGSRLAWVEPAEGRAGHTHELVAMWAGLKAGVPVVNGYSGRVPAGYPDVPERHGPGWLVRWLGPTPCRVIEGK